MNHSGKTALAIAIAVTAFIIVALTSANVAYYIYSAQDQKTVGTDTAQSDYDTRYQRLDEVYNRLMSEYYKEVDSDTLIQGAIDGMMASLDDPYTFYYTPEDQTAAEEAHEGNYVGIGIQVTYVSNGDICVTRVFRNGPAYEAGIAAGDILIKSNGYDLKATNSEELSEAISHIKGEEGSISHVTVKRGETELEFDVECRSVVNTRVEYSMLDDNVGYIALYEFFGDAVQAMEDALTYMQDNHAQSIILDLRDDTGGQLDICLEICNMFLPEGVIVYTEDRNGERQYYYSDGEYYEIPVAVLVNGYTASSSEIMAAAIQDYQRGTLVGQTTFGKGIVQTWYSFPVDGAGMQLTTSAYYTPSGRSIHNVGITPDIYVEADEVTEERIRDGMTLANDSVLRTAWELLTGKTYDAGTGSEDN